MNNEVKLISEKKIPDLICSIQEQVRIPSVRNLEDKTSEAPFGREIRKSLEHLINLAKQMGMRTFIDPEGYYGYVEIGPEDCKEMIGVIGHVDVVPEGNDAQWTEGKPFSGDIIDDKIIGRGSLDDKGPVIINLYAMKNIMDLEIQLNKRIRLIVGCAEETTWECMTKYSKMEEHPTIGYSPDANFPGIHAEKTIVQMEAKKDTEVDFELTAMGAFNAVPGEVKYKGTKANELASELEKLNYKFTKDSENEITVIGKGAHAMANHLGVNAVEQIAIALYNINERCEVINFLAEQVKETTSGEIFQGIVKEEVSGVLKYTVSRIEIKNGKQYIGMDTRIPVLADEKEIMKKYQDTIESYKLEYSVLKTQEKLYVPADSFLVKTLVDVYKDVTGDMNAKPLSSGGGTYARAFDNCIAFGCVFESQNMLDKMHQPNECFETKFLQPALEIYTNALIKLLK